MIDDFAAIHDLDVQLRPVAKFHHVARGRIENCLEFVAAILIASVESGLDLRMHALGQVLFRNSGEVAVEQARSVLFERLFHGLPCQRVITRNALTGEVFNRARAKIIGMQLHSRSIFFCEDVQFADWTPAGDDLLRRCSVDGRAGAPRPEARPQGLRDRRNPLHGGRLHDRAPRLSSGRSTRHNHALTFRRADASKHLVGRPAQARASRVRTQ